jgi:hypothetical protein
MSMIACMVCVADVALRVVVRDVIRDGVLDAMHECLVRAGCAMPGAC